MAHSVNNVDQEKSWLTLVYIGNFFELHFYCFSYPSSEFTVLLPTQESLLLINSQYLLFFLLSVCLPVFLRKLIFILSLFLKFVLQSMEFQGGSLLGVHSCLEFIWLLNLWMSIFHQFWKNSQLFIFLHYSIISPLFLNTI